MESSDFLHPANAQELATIAQETGEPLPAVFFLGVVGSISVVLAAVAFLARALLTRCRLSFPPKREGKD